jgi:hypothetical protein
MDDMCRPAVWKKYLLWIGFQKLNMSWNIPLIGIAYCAGGMNLSPGYFSDLIKKKLVK